MIHTYPRSRVCLIDISAAFEKGFKQAIAFAKEYHIQINSADGRRIVTSFCLENIMYTYQSTKSIFPKATCLSKKTIPAGLLFFIKTYFEDILKQTPIHYCGLQEISSPDLEYVALKALKQNVAKRDYLDLMSKLKIRKIAQ